MCIPIRIHRLLIFPFLFASFLRFLDKELDLRRDVIMLTLSSKVLRISEELNENLQSKGPLVGKVFFREWLQMSIITHLSKFRRYVSHLDKWRRLPYTYLDFFSLAALHHITWLCIFNDRYIHIHTHITHYTYLRSLQIFISNELVDKDEQHYERKRKYIHITRRWKKNVLGIIRKLSSSISLIFILAALWDSLDKRFGKIWCWLLTYLFSRYLVPIIGRSEKNRFVCNFS